MQTQTPNNSQFTASAGNHSSTFPHFPEQLFQTFPKSLKLLPPLWHTLSQQRPLPSIPWRHSFKVLPQHLLHLHNSSSICPTFFTYPRNEAGRTALSKTNSSTREPLDNPDVSSRTSVLHLSLCKPTIQKCYVQRQPSPLSSLSTS